MEQVLKSSPGNLVPDNHIAGYFTAFDGVKLRYAIFRSGDTVPRGTVVILQGRNESIEKYFETVRDLTRLGLWVAIFDWRGQGGSDRLLKDRRRGYVRRFSDYEKDIDTFLQSIVLPDAKMPFFLLAHSMGSLIAMSAAPNLANRIERMVLIAPFVGIVGQRPSMRRIRLISNVVSAIGLGFVQFNADIRNKPFEDNAVTSDPVRYQRNQGIVAQTPSLGMGPPTARWISEMIGAIDRVTTMEHLGKISIPALILAPTKDKVVPYVAMENLSRIFRAAHLVSIPGSGHEILQERDIFRAQALAAIDAFIPGSDAEPLVFDNT